ncbi:MAG: outer membrane protein assembly factor BamD [Proteobacteria bacterium]|nr:outer membrane protein assembly factor BamD [Pseudomonadota bacterium]
MKLTFCIILFALSTAGFSETAAPKKIQIQKHSYLSRSRAFPEAVVNDQRSRFLAKNRKNLIEEVKSALRFVKNDAQSEELQLRLANLFIEEFKYQNGKGADSKAYLQKAQGILKDLVRKSPPCKRRDEVLFQLAQGYLEFGQNERAHEIFSQLIVEFKQTPYLEEAYLQLGDSAFEKGQFAKSLSYYEKLIANPKSPLWLYAHYKSGWATYNLNQLSSTLNHFKTIVEQENFEGTAQQSLALKKEAIRDLCLPFAELKKYEEGVQFYSGQEEAFYRSGLECLASLAQERGDSLQSVTLYRDLINMDSQHRKNPSYSLSIVELHRKHGKLSETFSSLEDSLSGYLGDSTWKEIFSSDPTFIDELKSQYESTTRQLGLECHSTAQKTKNLQLYQQARAFYDLYLKYFPYGSEAPNIEFYRAEILYKEKDFSAATVAYLNVFKNSHASPKLRQEAIENAILASSQQVNIERKNAGLSELTQNTHTKRAVLEEESVQPFLDAEETFLKLADAYVEHFPKDTKTPQVLFQANYLRYLHHQNKPAYSGFWQIIQSYPKHETAQHAGLLLLDILNQKQDFPNMIAACKKLRTIPELQSGKTKNEVGDILRKAELKKISSIEYAGNFHEAGKSYLGYVEQYGSEDAALAEKALYNASVCLGKANLALEALKVQEQFLRKYPSSPYRKDMLLNVAKAYEAMADFGQAAQAFSTFQKEYPGHPQSAEALRLSGLYFWGNGNYESAEASMLKLVQSYPQLRTEAEKDLLDFYFSQGWFEKQFDYLVKARTAKGISFSAYLDLTIQLADLQEQKFNKPATTLWSEAEGVADKYRPLIQASPRGPELIGRILLRKTARKVAAFASVSIQSLPNKLKLLKELEKDFSEIATLGGDAGLASLHHISQAYLSLSQDIDAAPVPAELSGEQIDIYRKELSNQMISPFKEKAFNFAKQCLDKGQEHSLFSPWIAKCRQIASHLSPDEYARAVTYSLPPYYLAFPSTSSFLQSTPLFKESLKDRAFGENEIGVRMTSLQPMLEYRKEKLLEKGTSDSPQTKEETIAWFNSLRLARPSDAIYKIKHHLKTKSQDPSFHQLLALAYLDNGDLDRAKITWLSLLARGINEPYIYNNLAVVEALRGNLNSALNLFAEANELGSEEARVNQGFVALSFGNGFLAKSLFEKSLDASSDELAKIGIAISKIQNNDIENGKEELEDLQKQFPHHPLIYQQRLAITERNKDKLDSSQSYREIASESPEYERKGIQTIYDQSSLPELE